MSARDRPQQSAASSGTPVDRYSRADSLIPSPLNSSPQEFLDDPRYIVEKEISCVNQISTDSKSLKSLF